MGFWRTLGRIGSAVAGAIPGVGPFISMAGNTALNATEPKEGGGENRGSEAGTDPFGQAIKSILQSGLQSIPAKKAPMTKVTTPGEAPSASRYKRYQQTLLPEQAANQNPTMPGSEFKPLSAIANAGFAQPQQFKKGGMVKKTGYALVHKGEKVIPAARKKQAGKMLSCR